MKKMSNITRRLLSKHPSYWRQRFSQWTIKIWTTATANQLVTNKSNMDASSEISTPNASFEIHLWHRRYGHLHYARLYHLSQKDKVCGLPPFKLAHEICSNCLAGQHREHFPKASTHHSTQVLNLIHTNLVGTLKTASLSGS
jgi:ribosomal protein L32